MGLIFRVSSTFQRLSRGIPGILFALLFIPLVLTGTDDKKAVPGNGLDLLSAVKSAMKENPSILVEEMTVLTDKGLYREYKGSFDPALSASLTRERAYSTYPIDGPDWKSLAELEYALSLSYTQAFRNGMSLETDVSTTQVDTTLGEVFYNASAVTFTLSVPLLSGRGKASAGATEKYYKTLYEAGELTLHHTVSTYILQTAQAYWDYLAQTLNLAQLKQAEDRANTHLEEVNHSVKNEKLHEKEVSQAKAYHRTTTASRLAGEQALLTAKQSLGILMGIPFESIENLPNPIDSFPTVSRQDIDATLAGIETIIKKALTVRTDALAYDKSIEAAKVLVKKAKNEKQNTLDLGLSAGYESYNVNDKSVGGFFSSLWENRSGVTASVGLSYQLPIRNNANIGLLVQYQASARSQEIQKAALLRSISSSVLVSVSNIKNILMQLEQLKVSADTYENAYKTEKEKFKNNKSTQVAIITIEGQLTGAQLKVIAAKQQLAREIVNFRYQVGTLTALKDGKYSINSNQLTTIPKY